MPAIDPNDEGLNGLDLEAMGDRLAFHPEDEDPIIDGPEIESSAGMGAMGVAETYAAGLNMLGSMLGLEPVNDNQTEALGHALQNAAKYFPMPDTKKAAIGAVIVAGGSMAAPHAVMSFILIKQHFARKREARNNPAPEATEKTAAE